MTTTDTDTKTAETTAADTLVGGFPVAALREMLAKAPDNFVAAFITSYALGFGADQFIAAMIRPEERVGFLLGVAKTYPSDWAKALEVLSKEQASPEPK